MIFVPIADIHWDDCLTFIDSLCTPMLKAIPISQLKFYRPQEGVERHRLMVDGLGVKSYQNPSILVAAGHTCVRVLDAYS